MLASNADWGLRKLHDTGSRLNVPTTRASGRHGILQFLVRSEGLEPPRFYSLPPQGSASTNSATSA
jgi:hypothetical protein